MLTALTLWALSQLDLTPALEKGPLVLVEESKGKFATCSSIVLIDAPPEAVWEIVKAQEKFKDFVPKVLNRAVIDEVETLAFLVGSRAQADDHADQRQQDQRADV